MKIKTTEEKVKELTAEYAKLQKAFDEYKSKVLSFSDEEKAMIKEDKPIKIVYVVCLDVEAVEPDLDGDMGDIWHSHYVLGFYDDPNIADGAIKELIKSEKFKALEKEADSGCTGDVCVYAKAVPAFDLDSAYSVVDDAIDHIKEMWWK